MTEAFTKGLEGWRGIEYLNENNTVPTTQDKLSFVARVVLGTGLALVARRFSHCAFRAESLLVGTIAAETLDTVAHRCVFKPGLRTKEDYESEVIHLLGLKGIFRGMQMVCVLTLLSKSVAPSVGIIPRLSYAGLGIGTTSLIGFKTWFDNTERG